MIDPYARINERIRKRRRAEGKSGDEFDPLVKAASHELGAAAEAAIGLILDAAERIGLRYLEEAARTGATKRFSWAPDAVRGVRFASTRLPGASGRAISTSSELAMRTGLTVIRELRRRLESTRRGTRAGGKPGDPRHKPPSATARRAPTRRPAGPRPDSTQRSPRYRPPRAAPAADRESERA